MKKFILLASALLLVSCTEKISGTFNATKDVALRGKNGLVNVESGVHQATLKLRTKKKMTLVLNVNGRTEKLEFSVPKGLRIPTDHGQLRLTSQEVGQPYDMSATANTSVSRSEPRNTVESCSISVMRPVCRDVRAPSRTECHTDHYGRQICRTIPGGYRRVCTNEYVTLYGHRQITDRKSTRLNSSHT